MRVLRRANGTIPRRVGKLQTIPLGSVADDCICCGSPCDCNWTGQITITGVFAGWVDTHTRACPSPFSSSYTLRYVNGTEFNGTYVWALPKANGCTLSSGTLSWPISLAIDVLDANNDIVGYGSHQLPVEISYEISSGGIICSFGSALIGLMEHTTPFTTYSGDQRILEPSCSAVFNNPQRASRCGQAATGSTASYYLYSPGIETNLNCAEVSDVPNTTGPEDVAVYYSGTTTCDPDGIGLNATKQLSVVHV